MEYKIGDIVELNPRLTERVLGYYEEYGIVPGKLYEVVRDPVELYLHGERGDGVRVRDRQSEVFVFCSELLLSFSYYLEKILGEEVLCVESCEENPEKHSLN